MDLTPDGTDRLKNSDWKQAHEPSSTEPWYAFQKPGDSTYALYLKFIIMFEGVHPDNLFDSLSSDHLLNWNKQIPLNEIIEKNDQYVIVYQHMQKIPIPMFD